MQTYSFNARVATDSQGNLVIDVQEHQGGLPEVKRQVEEILVKTGFSFTKTERRGGPTSFALRPPLKK